ncbi:myoneurin-like [Phymastichus coffea]|uniref:myoneurin-like n=1 Tax=Phymastichus coffea TaxID=108790 RepID=UPI00273B3AEA|nr:myoneurin-like [Phymastichus coffea]
MEDSIINLYKGKQSDFYYVDVTEEMLLYENKQKRRSQDNKAYQCHQCPAAFTRKGCLTRHLRYECCQQPRFKCPYCDFRSKKTSHTYRHVREYHPGESVYFVDIATINYLLLPDELQDPLSFQPINYEILTLKVGPQRDHVCSKCNKSYLRSDHLSRHLQYECGIPPRFLCGYCPRRCRHKHNIMGHIKKLHKGLQTKYYLT